MQHFPHTIASMGFYFWILAIVMTISVVRAYKGVRRNQRELKDWEDRYGKMILEHLASLRNSALSSNTNIQILMNNVDKANQDIDKVLAAISSSADSQAQIATELGDLKNEVANGNVPDNIVTRLDDLATRSQTLATNLQTLVLPAPAQGADTGAGSNAGGGDGGAVQQPS